MEVFGTHAGSSPLDWVVHHSHESFISIVASHIFPNLANASADPSNHHPLSCRNALGHQNLGPHAKTFFQNSLWPAKDIHDLDGVHGDWLKHAAVTLVVHHHHEQVAAGDLLDHEGPANHNQGGQRERGKGKGRGTWEYSFIYFDIIYLEYANLTRITNFYLTIIQYNII